MVRLPFTNLTNLFALLIALGGVVASVSAQTNLPDKERQPVLSGELNDAKLIRGSENEVHVEFVIKNNSDSTVWISGLYSASRSRWEDHYAVNFTPDFWKSDRPGPEKFFENLVPLSPGESYVIPIAFPIDHKVLSTAHPITVAARYSISQEFSKTHSTWSGDIIPKPLVFAASEQ